MKRHEWIGIHRNVSSTLVHKNVNSMLAQADTRYLRAADPAGAAGAGVFEASFGRTPCAAAALPAALLEDAAFAATLAACAAAPAG
jgi:hypothetical protein